MKKWKPVLKKILFPGTGWMLLAVLLGGTSLALAFLVFGEDSPFAYAAYLLSAYALIVLIAATVLLLRRAGQALHRVPLAHRYLTDRYFKVRFGLVLSLGVNLCYVGLKLAGAVWSASFWDGALGVYVLLLCALRLYLICRVPTDAAGRELTWELRAYRVTGLFLLALNISLSGIAIQIVRHGESYNYPGLLIYAAAAYAFYSLTLSIVNTVKFRKYKSPILSATKAVNLTTALVSIFNLETAMIAQFGADEVQFRLVMTSCTAFAVCIAVLAIAAFMVISASRKLRRL